MKRRALLAAALAGAAPVAARAAPAPADNRAVMRRFVELFYVRRDVRAAFAKFVVPAYIQHNPGIADGSAAAVAALAPMFSATGAEFDVKHLLVDGDLAMVHLFGRGTPGTQGAAVADLYRLQGGRIVEHWDVIQPIAPGTHPLALAPEVAASPGDTTANRTIIAGFVDLMFRRKRVAAAFETYVAPDLVQHNAALGKGRAASIAALAPMFARPSARFEIRHTLVDGDRAAVHYHGHIDPNHAGAAVVEIFRLSGGRIVEHWDMFQPVPTTAVNPHPMF